MSEAALTQRPVSDILAMAQAVVKSRLFPQITSVEAAMTLMLICDAEGIHPMMALRRYDVIQGRPAMKTDAMLAEFQRRGGKVTWLKMDEECCEAEFMASGLGKPVRIKVDSSDAKRAGLDKKDNWLKYPRQMRRARVISEGVRAADPGVNAGVYTPEEVQDFSPTEQERPAQAQQLARWVAGAPRIAPEASAEPVEALSDELVDEERPAIFAGPVADVKSFPATNRGLQDAIDSVKTAENPIDASARKRALRAAVAVENGLPVEEALARISTEVAEEVAAPGWDKAFEQHLLERGLGQTCVKPGCEGVVESYTAGEDNGDKAGHVYLQCASANTLKNDARLAGVSKAKIREMIAGHSFAWS